jgi:hypothetical protein
MSPLDRLTHLEVLEIGWSNARDEDMEVVATMTGLNELRLQDCQVTDLGIRKLESCRKLERLDARRTQIQGSGLICLRHMPSLRECILKDTQADDRAMDFMSAVSGLIQLDLSGTRITDSGLQKLQALKHLRVLSVTRTRCTQEGVEALQRTIPGLIVEFSIAADQDTVGSQPAQ